jgi:hypothetical protein
MSVASGDLGDVTGGHLKIGAASHLGRNAAIVLATLAVGIGVVVYTIHSGQEDGTLMAQLGQFRAAYAQKCDAPAFQGEPSALLKDTYLKSERLQATVAKQQTALAAGTPCEEVARALRAADFPMAQAAPQ